MRNKIGAIAGLGLVVVILTAMPALAHVTVNPDQATKGGFVRLALQVPNEMESADTVKIELKLSSAHPIADVSVQPKAGWTVDVQKEPLPTPLTTDDGEVTEAVSLVTWSGGKIAPGEFDEFVISAGPLPDDVDSLTLPTVQTYSDGTEVAWNQETVAGQPEPERPAPALALVAAKAAAKTTTTSNNTRNLAIADFVLGAAALAVGSLAYVKVRRSR